jgi:hypothetical protein
MNFNYNLFAVRPKVLGVFTDKFVISSEAAAVKLRHFWEATSLWNFSGRISRERKRPGRNLARK